MPHTKSAKKRLAQSERRRIRNRNVTKALKTQMKKVVELSEGDDKTKLEAEVRLAAKKFAQAASKGIVHRNLAARKKSQLSRFLKAPAAAPAAAAKK